MITDQFKVICDLKLTILQRNYIECVHIICSMYFVAHFVSITNKRDAHYDF